MNHTTARLLDQCPPENDAPPGWVSPGHHPTSPGAPSPQPGAIPPPTPVIDSPGSALPALTFPTGAAPRLNSAAGSITAVGRITAVSRITAAGLPLLYLLSALLAAWLAPNRTLALARLGVILDGVTIFYLVCWAGARPQGVQRVAILLLLAGVAAALLSLVVTDWSAGQIVPGLSLAGRFPTLLRLPGSGLPNSAHGVNPRIVSGAMVLFLPLAFSLALFARRSALRWLGGLAALVLLLPFYLTQSPQGVLALALGLGLVLAYRTPWTLPLQVVLLALAAGAWHLWHWGLPPALVHRLQIGVAARLAIWPVALSMLRQNPLTGLGLNNFPVVQPRYSLAPGIQPHAHNVFLQTAVDQGLLGLAIFTALFVVAFIAAWRAYRHTADPDLGALILGCAGGCAACLGFGIWDSMSLGNPPALAIWAMLGLLAVAGSRLSPQGEACSPSLRPSPPQSPVCP